MSKKITWISEEEATALLGVDYKTLRIYTRNEKRRKWDILTTKPSKNKVWYSKEDLERHMMIHATK